jgi:hypothetical protein
MRLGWGLAMVLLAANAAGAQAAGAQAQRHTRGDQPQMCTRAVVDGKVTAGQSFVRMFAGKPGAGLELVLEALPSGWIVRVLPAGVARGAHDYAELATPPYRSVNPLLISTDFSFRSQDALAWNPRRFRYAASAAAFAQLSQLYPRVLANDARAQATVAELVSTAPEAELDILNGEIVAGTADQWRMAAAVASHLANTPHEVTAGEKPTPLGRITALEFRVRIDLPRGEPAAAGLATEQFPCSSHPTE